jgi:hypothetical protein
LDGRGYCSFWREGRRLFGDMTDGFVCSSRWRRSAGRRRRCRSIRRGSWAVWRQVRSGCFLPTDPGPIAVAPTCNLLSRGRGPGRQIFSLSHYGVAARAVEGSAATPKLKEAETNGTPKTPVVDIAAGWVQGGGRSAPQFGRVAPIEAPRFRHGSTVIGLATRGIMMIESCRVNEPTENQIPVGWNGYLTSPRTT